MRARSTRGAIGQSWWARRFLDVLESFALGTRLTRGRSYARAGQVLTLEIAPGLVTASVQGSRPRPYPVRIELARFDDDRWARIERSLAGQAFFSARLLAGDLPPELEPVFAEAGAPLFPATVDELRQHCGCPDGAVPCKHLAATFYLLVEAFDADPFRLLHWRGRSRAELLDRLRALRGAASASSQGATTLGSPPGTPAPASPPGPPAPVPPAHRPASSAEPAEGTDAAPGASTLGTAPAIVDLPATPLADLLDRYWLPPVPLPGRGPTLAADGELLLRSLPAPGGAIGGPGLTERLRPAYRAFGGSPAVGSGWPPEAGFDGSPPAVPEAPHQSGVDQEYRPADRAADRAAEDGHRG
jgi:uncharacterized Zn finger protein